MLIFEQKSEMVGQTLVLHPELKLISTDGILPVTVMTIEEVYEKYGK